MSSRIIIDGNAIYEVDEERLRKKKEKNIFTKFLRKLTRNMHRLYILIM